MSEDDYEIVVTDTAKSKAYRYLSEHAIEQCIRSPWQIYYDEERDNYLLRTHRQPDPKNFAPGTQPGKNERIVIIVAVDDNAGELVVVTQTQDHYDWHTYERVDSIGAPVGGDRDA